MVINNKQAFKSLNKLTKYAIILSICSLVLVILTNLFYIIFSISLENVSDSYTVDYYSSYSITQSNNIPYAIFDIIYYIVTFASSILFLWWIYRANKNIHIFGAKDIYSPTMSVIWFFIPFINILYGYRIAKQIWTASDTSITLMDGKEWKNYYHSLKIVKIWWILTILINILLFMSSYSLGYISILIVILSIISTILYIKIIKQVAKWQDQKAAKII